MPLGFTSGRPFTPLSVATSAFSSATACFRASFSASSRSAKASSSPRGRLERGIFAGADMPGKGRVRASPAQPRQLTSARPFAPRTLSTTIDVADDGQFGRAYHGCTGDLLHRQIIPEFRAQLLHPAQFLDNGRSQNGQPRNVVNPPPGLQTDCVLRYVEAGEAHRFRADIVERVLDEGHEEMLEVISAVSRVG